MTVTWHPQDSQNCSSPEERALSTDTQEIDWIPWGAKNVPWGAKGRDAVVEGRLSATRRSPRSRGRQMCKTAEEKFDKG